MHALMGFASGIRTYRYDAVAARQCDAAPGNVNLESVDNVWDLESVDDAWDLRNLQLLEDLEDPEGL